MFFKSCALSCTCKCPELKVWSFFPSCKEVEANSFDTEFKLRVTIDINFVESFAFFKRYEVNILTNSVLYCFTKPFWVEFVGVSQSFSNLLLDELYVLIESSTWLMYKIDFIYLNIYWEVYLTFILWLCLRIVVALPFFMVWDSFYEFDICFTEFDICLFKFDICLSELDISFSEFDNLCKIGITCFFSKNQ